MANAARTSLSLHPSTPLSSPTRSIECWSAQDHAQSPQAHSLCIPARAGHRHCRTRFQSDPTFYGKSTIELHNVIHVPYYPRVHADVHIAPDGRPKGSGIVAFETVDDARNAITQFNGYDFTRVYWVVEDVDGVVQFDCGSLALPNVSPDQPSLDKRATFGVSTLPRLRPGSGLREREAAPTPLHTKSSSPLVIRRSDSLPIMQGSSRICRSQLR